MVASWSFIFSSIMTHCVKLKKILLLSKPNSLLHLDVTKPIFCINTQSHDKRELSQKLVVLSPCKFAGPSINLEHVQEKFSAIELRSIL